MKLLEDVIVKKGEVLPGDVLKVDFFLNHQIDVKLVSELGKEFHRLYKDMGINKILTIEASGIGVACLCAQHFDCNVVFAKKTKSKNLNGDFYVSEVYSYTRGQTYEIMVSKKYLGPNDKVLIIDDFLAKGSALLGLYDIIKQSGATLAGAGIVIEKMYQGGGDKLRDKGVRIESLAKISKMTDEGQIEFAK